MHGILVILHQELKTLQLLQTLHTLMQTQEHTLFHFTLQRQVDVMAV